MPFVITLVDAAGNVALATAEDTVEDILLDGQSVVQIAQAIRAPSARPLNRGNRTHTLSFRVKKKPAASPPAALRQVVELEILFALRRGPSLTLQFSGAGGFTLTFSHAVLVHRGRAPGTSSHHEYTITGGGLSLA